MDVEMITKTSRANCRCGHDRLVGDTYLIYGVCVAMEGQWKACGIVREGSEKERCMLQTPVKSNIPWVLLP